MGYTRRTRLCFLSPHVSIAHAAEFSLAPMPFQAKIAFINEFRKLIWNNFFFNLKFCLCRLKLLFDTIPFPRISSATTPHSPSLTFEHGNMQPLYKALGRNRCQKKQRRTKKGRHHPILCCTHFTYKHMLHMGQYGGQLSDTPNVCVSPSKKKLN